MSEETTQIYDQIVTIMKNHTQAEVAFSMETHIASDLAIDSVGMFELMMDVEEHFDIGFSVEEGTALDTVKALVEAVAQKRAG